MKIRTATEFDEPELRLLWELGQKEFARQPYPYQSGSFDDLLERLRERTVLVSESDTGSLCGYVAYVLTGTVYSGLTVVVSPACRKKGIGRALVESAHFDAHARGGRHAVTLIWDGSGLLPFYMKAGYLATGHVLTKEL